AADVGGGRAFADLHGGGAGAAGVGGVAAVGGRDRVRASADRGWRVGHRAAGCGAAARERAARAAEGAGPATGEADGAGGSGRAACGGGVDGGGAGGRLADRDGRRTAAAASAGRSLRGAYNDGGARAPSVGGVAAVGGGDRVRASADRGWRVGHRAAG